MGRLAAVRAGLVRRLHLAGWPDAVQATLRAAVQAALRAAWRRVSALRLRALATLAPWRRRRTDARPELVVDAEPWLACLLRSVAVVSRSRRLRPTTMAVVVGPGRRARLFAGGQIRVVGYRTGTAIDLDPAPFVAVDAMWRRPVRTLRHAPDDVRALNEAASRPVPRPPRDGIGTRAYIEACRTAHVAARLAYRRHSLDVLSEIGVSVPSATSGGDVGVSILCATNRPAQLDAIADNVRRQRHRSHELVLVAHGDGFDERALTDAFAGVNGARWFRAPKAWALGTCLNYGMERCSERFVAKFDDDDLYGPEYLGDSLLAVIASGAAIVGKHSYFAVLERSNRTVVRFPGRECRFTPYLAGGTLLIDRQAIGSMRFPDQDIGEDQELIGRCLRAGQSVFAGDMFNYVQHRSDQNTWPATDDYLGRGALLVGDASLASQAIV